jgi:hypothetical protein
LPKGQHRIENSSRKIVVPAPEIEKREYLGVSLHIDAGHFHRLFSDEYAAKRVELRFDFGTACRKFAGYGF